MPDPSTNPAARIDTVGIISKPRSEQGARVVPALLEWLGRQGIATRMDAETAAYLGRKEFFPREQVPEGAQLLIVLGGDGTLLSAARAVGDRNIPLFAVNLGNLGFLTSIAVDDLYPQLERALRGDYRMGKRRMLRTDLLRDGRVMASYTALNDVTVAKVEMARIIDLEVHVDGHFMCRYKADGLIVSTPTGSTAYSLSAGGPIVLPTVAAVCITPICPHMLTYRPVIVPDDSVIEITFPGDDEAMYLTIDGQVGELLRAGDRVMCQRSPHTISLIHPPDLTFFDVLREKLKWGGR